MERFRLGRRRAQFAWGRLAILAAGAALARPGERPSLEERPPFSPDLRVGDRRYFACISHSADRIAVIVSERPCAIDIEPIDPGRSLEGCARVAFGREAASGIAALPDPVEGFYRAWGRLECAVKLGAREAFAVEKGEGLIRGFGSECSASGGWMTVTAHEGSRKPAVLRATAGDFCRILSPLARG